MRKGTRPRIVASLYLGTFITLLDVSIVNVALPTLQSALRTDLAGLQWIIDAYVLCLSSFMLSAGALSDRFGRKRAWLIGVCVFVLGSAICAIAPNLPLLLIGRVVQGVAGALIVPGALSILTQAFPDPRERAHAIAGWASFSTTSFIVGPPLGGFLIDTFGWPSIFLINLPVGLIAFALGSGSISESSHPEHAPVDAAGQALSILWLGALAFGLIEGGAEGWGSPSCVTALAVAMAGFITFLFVEARAARPMLPLGLFRNSEFAATNAASFVLGFAAFSSVFLYSLFLQNVHGLSPSATGARMVPIFVAQVLFSVLSGRLTARFGPYAAMIPGYLLIGLSMLGVGLSGADAGGALLGSLFAAQGIGMGLAIPATSTAAMASVKPERTGIASAIINATRQSGTTVGIALLGSLMSMQATSLLVERLEKAGISPADAIARSAVTRHDFAAAGQSAETVSGLYAMAFAGGFRWTLVVAGGAALLATVLLGLAMRRATAPSVSTA